MRLGITTNVKIKIDRKPWERMSRNLLRGSNQTVQVGIWGSFDKDGVSNAQKLKWNEEGHINGGKYAGTYTPARPAMRVGFMKQVPKIVSKYYHNVHMIALGKLTWNHVNQMMGKELEDALKKTIQTWTTPSNTALTISLKGFNNPLVETGNMYEAVKHRIVRRG